MNDGDLRGAGSAGSADPAPDGMIARTLGGQSSPLAKQLRALASGHASMAGSAFAEREDTKRSSTPTQDRVTPRTGRSRSP